MEGEGWLLLHSQDNFRSALKGVVTCERWRVKKRPSQYWTGVWKVTNILT